MYAVTLNNGEPLSGKHVILDLDYDDDLIEPRKKKCRQMLSYTESMVVSIHWTGLLDYNM